MYRETNDKATVRKFHKTLIILAEILDCHLSATIYTINADIKLYACELYKKHKADRIGKRKRKVEIIFLQEGGRAENCT